MSDDSSPRRAGASTDRSEIQITGSEKLLAGLLAVFISIGAVWSYDRLDRVNRPADRHQAVLAPSDRVAIDRHQAASRAVRLAARERRQAMRELELRREAYRTALDAGEPASGLRERYEAARVELAAATVALRRARAARGAAAPDAAAARRRARRALAAISRRLRAEQQSHDRLVLVLRLALLTALLAGSYRLLGRLRARGSRYVPVALALSAAGAVLAVTMAGDYGADYVDLAEVGPLAVSLVGIALTLAAFAALQRYLRRRLPLRRVRRGECPFCGYPARAGDHCEGCGRRVVAGCSTCERPRRVGTPRCASCGNA